MKKKNSGLVDKDADRWISKNMIFQDPMASLSDQKKFSCIVAEGLKNIKRHISESEKSQAVYRVLSEVGLLPEFASRFPHAFSGGQRQRIGIARALIMEPEFIVANEPISALDVSIRAQVLNLLMRLQMSRKLTYLRISHDLSVMRLICDRIAVIYKGMLVEHTDAQRLFAMPLQPYTRALFSAIPMVDPAEDRKKVLTIYHPGIHKYDVLPPEWTEIKPDHFVLTNVPEQEVYKDMLGQSRKARA